jgi:hypothetical protein
MGTAVVGFVEVGILVRAIVGRDVEGMPVRAVKVGIFVGVFEEGEEGELVSPSPTLRKP